MSQGRDFCIWRGRLGSGLIGEEGRERREENGRGLPSPMGGRRKEGKGLMERDFESDIGLI